MWLVNMWLVYVDYLAFENTDQFLIPMASIYTSPTVNARARLHVL
jgi:hypothetical protein